MKVIEALDLVDSLVFSKTNKHLTDLQRIILEASWSEQRTSYEDIAASHGYSSTYLKQDVGPKLWLLLSEVCGEKVKKANFKAAIERQSQLKITQPPVMVKSNEAFFRQKIQDWGEAPDVSVFYGRDLELRQLEEWVIKDRCRLVAIFGMGGIGKTHFAKKKAQQLEGEFDYVVWRSLSQGARLPQILTSLLQILSHNQEKDLPTNVDEQVSSLINYLKKYRCLIIFDNLETILGEQLHRGQYLPGYEDYSKLFKTVGEREHSSCLMVTTREKPKEIGLMEGDTLPVRSLRLKGLSVSAAKDLLVSKGCAWNSEEECNFLVEQYSGNPLALKIVCAVVQDLFQGNIAELIKHKALVFEQINELLEQHFERLPALSQTFLYWLAIAHDLVTIEDLENDLYPKVATQTIIETISSIFQLSLVEKKENKFYLQPVIKEYLLNKLIEAISQEIQTGNLSLINQHSLLKANTQEYNRNAQTAFIIKPLIERLLTSYKNQKNLVNRLKEIIQQLKPELEETPGYGAGNILNILCQMKIDLSGYDFSNLTVWQAYLQDVNLHQVNFAYADLSKSVFAEQLSNILSVAFSPKGEILATGDTNGEIRLWLPKEGKLWRLYKGHASWVHSVCFSPDGLILASGSSDHEVKLWNLRGECIKTLSGHTQQVRSVAFSPDGQSIASGSSDATVRIWDLDTQQCRLVLSGHTKYIWSVCFSPNGEYLASGSEDKTIKLWDVATGECRQTLKGHSRWVRSLDFSPDGRLLASGSGDKTIKLWDVATGECRQTLKGHTERVRSLMFSPDGQSLVSGGGDHTVRLWDVKTGNSGKILHGHNSRLNAVSFSADGRFLATGGEDRMLKLWEVATGQCLKTWRGSGSWIQSVAFSPDGKFLASGSEDQTLKLWDFHHSSNEIRSLSGHQGWVCSVSFSPDGQILASASSDYTLKLWDVTKGTCINTLLGHTRWIRCVTFSPDGQYLASGGGDCCVKLWDVTTGQCIQTLLDHTGWLWSVAFSPDGKTLVSASEDKTLKLWDVTTGECLKTFEGHLNWVQCVAFSPDGKTIASAGCDRTVRLWNVATGKCDQILKGHFSWVQCLAFSPDGEYLATGSCDETVKVWHLKNAKCLITLKGHSNWVWSVAFSPDGKILASGSQDETLKLWDIHQGECFQTLRTKRSLEGMCIAKVKGLTQAEIDTLKDLGATTEVNTNQTHFEDKSELFTLSN